MAGAHVQSVHVNGAGNQTVAITCTAGNTLIVNRYHYTTTLQASPSDTGSNSYVLELSKKQTSSSGWGSDYSAHITTGGSLTVTVPFGASGGRATVSEYSGLLATNNVAIADVSSSNVGTSSAPTSGSTAATTAANEEVIGFYGFEGIGTSDSITASTITNKRDFFAGSSVTGDVGDNDVSSLASGATANANWNVSGGGSHNWVGLCVVFKLAAASTAVPPLPPTVVRQAVNRMATF